jgi:hypothetical protein
LIVNAVIADVNTNIIEVSTGFRIIFSFGAFGFATYAVDAFPGFSLYAPPGADCAPIAGYPLSLKLLPNLRISWN